MDEFTLMCTNIQGLRTNLTELKYVLKKNRPSICIVTETHITSEIENSEIKVSGFRILRCDSTSNHTGGVIAFVQSSLRKCQS